MNTVDKDVMEFYDKGGEKGRLRSGIGLIEFERTKELLAEYLPKPPAVIYDIGGGYGEYSWWLASLGYEVHLFDLSAKNIEMSAEPGREFPNAKLAASEVCDARIVPRADKTADAVLLMGPLYHLTEYSDRIAAIKESKRLLKDNGLLFSAALTPYSVLLHSITLYRNGSGAKSTRLDNLEFIEMVERELRDGCHINPDNRIVGGLGTSHLHSAAELKAELLDGGFANTKIHGVMGGAWLAPNIDALWADPNSREALMRTVRMLDGHDEVIGLSGHLLAVSGCNSNCGVL
ncbi:MAG: class I SAM-dependent methyltransferase [Clostridia bacterium]|nr:class I SAM-dependent methyltransferase [Clostridia bacterium]